MPDNELYDFMRQATDGIAAEYERIRRRTREDPGTAGDQGEENWASILREWLPSIFHIVTKGRILGFDGRAGPQVDILILSEAYPKFLLDKKLYLAGDVIAAFECKNMLIGAHIDKALENARAIRSLIKSRYGSPFRELNSGIIYGLLAHSHTWINQQATPLGNVSARLEKGLRELVHPRDMLDILCVADLATWVGSRLAYFGPKLNTWEDNPRKLAYPNGYSSSTYMQFSKNLPHQTAQFTPIGSMLDKLFRKIAW